MPTVIGREEEQGAIEAFLAGIHTGPGALVLSGEAGIGKTILWEVGVEEGAALMRGVEAEATSSPDSSFLFDDVAPTLLALRRRGSRSPPAVEPGGTPDARHRAAVPTRTPAGQGSSSPDDCSGSIRLRPP
jgi:hypothetical protein